MAMSHSDQFHALKSLTGSKLNIVAIGKTGEGKSATLNTVIKCAGNQVEQFRSEGGVTSVSMATDQRTVNAFGFNIRVVDTIGLFDTELTAPRPSEQYGAFNMPELDSQHQVVLTELAKVITWCDEGIHAFLFVIRADTRFTMESEETVEIILRYFGSQLLDYVFFVLTHADRVDGKQMHDAQKRIERALVTKGYSGLKERFVPMDNTNDAKAQQQTLNMIKKIEENMKEKRTPYQHAAFACAQEMWKEQKEKLKREAKEQIDAQIRTETEKLDKQYRTITNSLEQQIAQQLQAFDNMQNATAEERRAFQEKVNEMQQQLLQMDHERMEEVARVKDEISTRLDAEYNQKFRDLQDELAKQGLVTQQAESLRKQLELELHKIRTENAQLRKKRDGCTLL